MKFRFDMLKRFISLGHEVVVLGNEPEGSWSERFKFESIRYRTYPVSRNGVNPLHDMKMLKALKDALREEKPDKIFTYQAKPNIYGSIAASSLEIDEVYPMMGGIGSVFMPKNLKQKVVKSILLAEYRYAFSRVKKIFFQNKDDSAIFISGGLCNANQIEYVNGSGVNTAHFSLEPLPEDFSFLYVGRLIRDKGLYEYLEAARMLRKAGCEATFHVVGDLDTNPSSMSEKEIASFVDDGSVIWHGWKDDVRPFLKACSVFVLPSYREGTPKAALEAMSTGRAVVVADTPGCREVVDEGVNGLLVPVGDSHALAAAMLELSNNPALTFRMGAASRKIAEDRFDVDKVNDVICRVMGL